MSEHEREAYQAPRRSLLFARRGGFVNDDEHADDEDDHCCNNGPYHLEFLQLRYATKSRAVYADDADGGDQNGNDCQYYQDSIGAVEVLREPRDQRNINSNKGAKDDLKPAKNFFDLIYLRHGLILAHNCFDTQRGLFLHRGCRPARNPTAQRYSMIKVPKIS